MEDIRQVNLYFTTIDVKDMIQSTGSPVNVYSAIGYLSTWGVGYDEVKIYKEPHCNDMVAVYDNTKTPFKRFTIGAIWDNFKKEYSFNS